MFLQSTGITELLLSRQDLDLTVLDKPSSLGPTLTTLLQSDKSSGNNQILDLIKSEKARRASLETQGNQAQAAEAPSSIVPVTEDIALNTEIQNAFLEGDEATLTQLLQSSKISDVNKLYGSSPLLHLSIEFDIRSVINWLLSKESLDVNKQDSSGITALNLACFIGNTDIVDLLLSRPEIKAGIADHEGSTPLRAACISKNFQLLPKLFPKLNQDEVDCRQITNGSSLKDELRKMQREKDCNFDEIQSVIEELIVQRKLKRLTPYNSVYSTMDRLAGVENMAAAAAETEMMQEAAIRQFVRAREKSCLEQEFEKPINAAEQSTHRTSFFSQGNTLNQQEGELLDHIAGSKALNEMMEQFKRMNS